MLGTLLLVALTVLIAGALTIYIVAAHPEPIEEIGVELAMEARPGDCPWDGGDESVVLRHRGGEDLHTSVIAVVITIGDDVVQRSLADAEGLSPDETAFSIGEEASFTDLRIGTGELVTVEVIKTGSDAHVVHSASIRATSGPC